MRIAPGLTAIVLCLMGAACAPAAAVPLSAKRDGVAIEVVALRDDVIRVRIGRSLARQDSYAIRPDALTAQTRAEITHDASGDHLKTAAMDVVLDPKTLRLTVKDASGRTVLDDAAPAPSLQGEGFSLKKRLDSDAHIFGLGDKAGPVDRRGRAFTLWNTDAFGFGPDTDPLYKAIPFFLSVDSAGRSYGLFLDNSFRTRFDFGSASSDEIRIASDGGSVDYYVFTGPTPKDVVQAYAWLTGTTPLPPLWSLGFQQSRYSYMTAGEVEGIADRLRGDKIPSDVIYLDIDYQDRNRPFSVNGKAFPDLPGLSQRLLKQGLHLVLITDLHIAKAPGQGYAPYDTGLAGDHFVKAADGSDYIGKVWPGPAVFPDFSRQATRRWWGELYRGFAAAGVGGFWNDMNEPSVFGTPSLTMPQDVRHRIEEPGFETRTAAHAEMHNLYGMLNSRATYEGLTLLRPDRRPFVLTRASYAGGQRYAATWTGDNTSSFKHLSLATSMLINLGLSGFSMVGDDLGGFAGPAPSPELLTRWIELGAFQPMFRDHAAKGRPQQEVWVHGPEHEAIRRRYIEVRYRLAPYLYAAAETASRTGLPVMRPVFLNYPLEAARNDQGSGDTPFMLGDDLLIAPAPATSNPGRFTVRLPGGGWTDYWTGARLDEDTVEEAYKLDRLPVFVRPGAILPHQPLVQSLTEKPPGPLELQIYPGPDCRGRIYADDGESFAYRRGDYLSQAVTCAQQGDHLILTFAPREGRYSSNWSSLILLVRGWSGRAVTAQYNGHALPSSGGGFIAEAKDLARGGVVVIGP